MLGCVTEFHLDFRAQGIEDGFGALSTFEDADGESFCAGADEYFVTRDVGVEEHLFRQELPESCGGFGAFGKIALEHGEADAEDVESGVVCAETVEAFEEFGDGADAEGFGLLRDENGIDGGDDVVGDAEETCGVVEDADVVLA